MQLKHFIPSLLILNFGLVLAQDKKQITVDFLLNYYDQAGDHSAVTGGKGTEALTDAGSKIIINIPHNENNSFTISFTADSYSSASSDNIDPVRTGASSQDVHIHGNIEYSVDRPSINSAYSVSAGFSSEFDYNSFSFGGSWSIYSQDRNRYLSFSTNNFIDRVSIIYPIELRNGGKLLSADKRKTYSLSINYNQVISKKIQLSLMTDLVYQKGLLSTSFNRVYFKDAAIVDIERLPNNRFKYPIGLQVNYLLSDLIVARVHYRYYNDDFGIKAHSFSLETPLRVTQVWSFIPFIRFHDQQGSDYFAPYKQHSNTEKYYTSDYDLSSFTSLKLGLGGRYYPLDGFGNFPLVNIKRLDLRFGYYDRSDGLNSYFFTTGISFAIF